VIHDVCDRAGNLVGFAPRSVLRRVLCRFVGRRVASVEMRAVLTGVREAPRHEIAGAVR